LFLETKPYNWELFEQQKMNSNISQGNTTTQHLNSFSPQQQQHQRQQGDINQQGQEGVGSRTGTGSAMWNA
jgi:hypothetical protein